MKKSTQTIAFGPVKTVKELGALMRQFRRQQQITLERVAGITHLNMRFLSELERGKETAELGKALAALNKLGLDVIIQPRGYSLSQQQRGESDE